MDEIIGQAAPQGENISWATGSGPGWGDMLNNLAQDYVGQVYQRETTPNPTVAGPTGASYQEGKPAGGASSMFKNPLVIAGGVVALGLIGWLVLRK